MGLYGIIIWFIWLYLGNYGLLGCKKASAFSATLHRISHENQEKEQTQIHKNTLLYFEWPPPWQSFVMVSDISSGCVHGIYFLTFYSGIRSDILFCHSILPFYSDIIFWHSILPFYLAFIVAFLSGILSHRLFWAFSYTWPELQISVGTAGPQRECPLRSGGPAVPMSEMTWESNIRRGPKPKGQYPSESNSFPGCPLLSLTGWQVGLGDGSW